MLFADENEKTEGFADGYLLGAVAGATSPSIASLVSSLKNASPLLSNPAVLAGIEGLLETAVEEVVLILEGENINLASVGVDFLINCFTSGHNPQMDKLSKGMEKVAKKLGKWFEDTVEKGKKLIDDLTENSGKPKKESKVKGNGGSNSSTNNIDEFIKGNKSFDDVLDDYAQIYADNVNSNQIWSWDDTVPGGDSLSKKQRRLIKQQAIDNGLIPEITVTKVDGMKYGFADFESAGVVKETVYLPEEMWKMSDAEQFKWLNKQIGGAIEGYTWHHTEVPGKMQLVPTGIHNVTTHNGGRTSGMWADASR